VRRRLEVGQKRCDDGLLDVLSDPAKRHYYVGCFGSWPALAERYAERKVGILLAFRIANQGAEGTLGEYVAVFERLEADELEVHVPEVSESGTDADDEMQRPVLVEVVQGVEVFERGTILSTVRLHLLDETPRIWMDGTNSVVEFALGRSALPEDREFGLLFDLGRERAGRVSDGQIQGKVVERGTEVEEALTEQRSPPDQRRPFVNLDYPTALACFHVVLTDSGVRLGVDKATDSTLEVLSMHVCPAELLADPWTY
jgi:hypothetical protein